MIYGHIHLHHWAGWMRQAFVQFNVNDCVAVSYVYKSCAIMHEFILKLKEWILNTKFIIVIDFWNWYVICDTMQLIYSCSGLQFSDYLFIYFCEN